MRQLALGCTREVKQRAVADTEASLAVEVLAVCKQQQWSTQDMLVKAAVK
jgi:hypothetical protein